jgi:hypothetical protein
MKCFLKLIDSNVIPPTKYLDLLQRTVNRLRDQTVNVRKNGLKLLQSIIIIFKAIFLNILVDEKFPTLEKI